MRGGGPSRGSFGGPRGADLARARTGGPSRSFGSIGGSSRGPQVVSSSFNSRPSSFTPDIGRGPRPNYASSSRRYDNRRYDRDHYRHRDRDRYRHRDYDRDNYYISIGLGGGYPYLAGGYGYPYYGASYYPVANYSYGYGYASPYAYYGYPYPYGSYNYYSGYSSYYMPGYW